MPYEDLGYQNSASTDVLQVRSVEATEYPARYSFFSVEPPTTPVSFGEEGRRHAFGSIVTYFDENGDSNLDVARKSMIGYSAEAGVLFVPQRIDETGGRALSIGYHLYREMGGCTADVLSLPPEIHQDASTPLVV